jgi:predicted alpha/beta superfamily hydrolase
MIKTDFIYSENLGRSVQVDVRYIEGFEHVLYCLDGQNMFFQEFSTFNKIWHVDQVVAKLESSNYKKTLIIAVWSNPESGGFERFREYSIADNDDLLEVNDPRYKDCVLTSKGIDTVKFFKDELIPYIDNKYTVGENITKSIMGSSMGGLMSLVLISELQTYFTNAFCLSNAFWYNYSQIKEYFAKINYDNNIFIYLDCGTLEDTKIGATNKNYLDVNLGIYDLLKEKDVDVMYQIIEGGIHDENSWCERLPNILIRGRYE